MVISEARSQIPLHAIGSYGRFIRPPLVQAILRSGFPPSLPSPYTKPASRSFLSLSFFRSFPISSVLLRLLSQAPTSTCQDAEDEEVVAHRELLPPLNEAEEEEEREEVEMPLRRLIWHLPHHLLLQRGDRRSVLPCRLSRCKNLRRRRRRRQRRRLICLRLRRRRWILLADRRSAESERSVWFGPTIFS